MKNKGFIAFLTILVSSLCLYYLFFTFYAQSIDREAIDYAREEDGSLNFARKQDYLDSIWHTPVLNILGKEFTYKEVKETELKLGLDLRGGMHVTMRVSPEDIVQGLAGGNVDEFLAPALKAAGKSAGVSSQYFVSEFYQEYRKLAPDKPLSLLFATVSNRGRIDYDTSDEEILEILRTEVSNAIDRSFNILRTRIDRFGTSQPNIQKIAGSGLVQIELPGVENQQRVKKLLRGIAKLEFWEVYEEREVPGIIERLNQEAFDALLLTEGDSLEGDQVAEVAEELIGERDFSDVLEADSGQEDAGEDDSLVQEETAADQDGVEGKDIGKQLDSLEGPKISPLISLLKSNYGLFYSVKDTSQINRILNLDRVAAAMPPDLRFLWSVKPVSLEQVEEDEILEMYPIRVGRDRKAPLTGEVIIDARQDLDDRSRPAISMQMNSKGTRAWRKLTSSNIGKRVAIVLDDYVYSAPTVQGEIPNGNSSITGDFTIEEAQDLSNILKSGTLPAKTEILEDVVVGPTLGKVAQRQGIISILAGLGAVIVFMIFYYSSSGLVANLALFLNIFFILGILAQLDASLTLPGIAGIVLTIGMAIDANVLIFERIKEEIRNGLNLKNAIDVGYRKAYSSIIDANVTTFLTGVILYWLGRGPIKGFAITLIVGIVCSFFSSVFITRLVFELFNRKKDSSLLAFSIPMTRNVLRKPGFNFLGHKRLAYVLSGVVICSGLLAMTFKGFTLGIDFKGGRSYVVSFDRPQEPTRLEAGLSDYFDRQGLEVKSFGGNDVVKVTTSYLVEDPSAEADESVREALVAGLKETTGGQYVEDDGGADVGPDNVFSIVKATKVGATIAEDIRDSAGYSVVFGLVVIFLYILIRFRRWQFGVGAIMALFHDTLLVLSAFAIANVLGVSYEVDQVFIAALLTIIGYSINDTVVVFDRVRENLRIRAGSDVSSIFNDSLNNTVSRTLITSGTTFMVVLVLFLFGGPALKGFSFALMVGIIVGTYSSMFIATPITLDLIRAKRSRPARAEGK